MAENSAISWTDHTWNPWIGCTKVSPACERCYAEQWALRYGRAQWGDHPRERTSAATWAAPHKWNRETPGAFVFCASLADIFDNQVDPQWRADAFDVMRATPRLTYLLLTKRPQNIERLSAAAGGLPANALPGCTVVTQEEADRDLPKMRGPHFVSIEPMLGPIRLHRHFHCAGCPECHTLGCGNPSLRWVICGGESGRGARPIDPEWVRALRDQCCAAGVPFHFKQWGGRTAKANGKTLDGREWCERPQIPMQERAA